MRDLAKRDELAQQQRAAEALRLAAVKVAAADVAVVQHEFDVSRAVAERALRENAGDLERTLRALLAERPPFVA